MDIWDDPLTCPGCSNKCSFKLPTSFKLPVISFPNLLPDFSFPDPSELLDLIPTLPSIPSPLFKFAGTLPTITKPWSANKHYNQGETITVWKPSTGAPGERKTVLTYIAQNAGIGGATTPVWGLSEVTDGAVVLKLTKTYSGISGDCPNSQGTKK